MKKLFFLLNLIAIPALAGGLPTLDAVVVTPHDNEALIGEAASASEGTVTAAQLARRPLLRPAEVLEVVPGLIISQHSGDGKANQYYLRGFNLDHGSDFAVQVMGMPVNMPSHGHGQGYLDLQFLIPELIEQMQYRKGPYAAEVGDFATAGSASIDYLRRLDAPFAQATVGQRGYRRGLVADQSGDLLYAVEWTENNGPWTTAENIGKWNALLRYSRGDKDNGWSATAMHYRAQWTATDQVPQRAIDRGLISRWGNLDASDGGRTGRSSLSGEWSRRSGEAWSRANAYLIDYRLNLWSNFTYCLSDIALSGACNRGDQFEQADRRKVYGLHAAHTWFGDKADYTLGVQSRNDDIDGVGLYATTRRQRWGTIREDRVRQASLSIYGEATVRWHDTLRTVLGLRGDAYRFRVNSDTAANSGRVSDRVFSPKLAVILGPWAKTEFYANAGYGFHSNDARGITARVNPDFRDTANFRAAVDPSTPLVRAKGYELGLRTAIVPRLQSALAIWRLDLASELLFVGDAGTTEASFPSRRVGIEWANYWTPTRALTIDADLALSRARFTRIDAATSGHHVPGAIERTLSVGASWDDGGPWSGGLRLRYFGPRALVEDNAVRSKASTLVNLRAAYRLDRRATLSLDVLNLFDKRVSDIDYHYESQLATEGAAVNDIHTHPAEPRSLRLTLRAGF